MDGFIDKLVDWRAFERFVRDMYAEDPDLVVEHDVTEVGKSGARRQIDVKFTHKVRAHTYVTLVECKRWKSKVSRDRVDVLASCIEDLNASKGVIFTTTGFEPGAEAYARSKGIDLFLVRDLTDKEWGLPGRAVWFYMHLYTAKIDNFKPEAKLLATVPNPPTSLNLQITIGKDQELDEALALHSLGNGRRGPNLMSLIFEARSRTLEWLSKSVGLFSDGANSTKSFTVPMELDLSQFPYREMIRSYGLLRFDQIALDLVVNVSQSRLEFDRGKGLDLALAVENYVTRQRSVVTRRANSSEVAVVDLKGAQPSEEVDDDVLENGTLFQVFTEPWVDPGAVEDGSQRTKSIAFKLPNWDITLS